MVPIILLTEHSRAIVCVIYLRVSKDCKICVFNAQAETMFIIEINVVLMVDYLFSEVEIVNEADVGIDINFVPVLLDCSCVRVSQGEIEILVIVVSS